MKKSFLAQSIYSAGIFCFAATLPALANDDIQQEIVTTATRTPVPLADSLASVTVISREDIAKLQPVDLVDIFSRTPGLDISRSGGPGSAVSLFTRGTTSDHTLILVDGQRISSATLGSTNFQFLDPEQIERIEVVRGARSSLYGSDAIGGVIQIFTRDGSSKTGSYVSASTGSHNLSKITAGISGQYGGFHYGLNLSYLNTDGFDNLALDTGFNKDDDAYRNKTVNANAGYRFDNGADLVLSFLESNNRNEHDSVFSPTTKPYTNTRLQNINLRGSLPVTDFWLSNFSVGTATDDSNNYDSISGLGTGDFVTHREQLFWQNDFTLADNHLITVGYDYYEDQVDASTHYMDSNGKPVKRRDNSALFAQYQGNWSRLDVVLGVREDDNEEFGTHTTGNISIGFQINDNHRLILGWAEGFKAPTFNDLYWPASAFSAGNPNLKPESSENSEVTLRGNYEKWNWSLSYYQNDVKNLIDWAPGPDFVWRPYNVSDAEITGSELTIGAILSGWQVDAAFSYVEPRDAEQDTLLIKRSRSNLTLNADKAFGDFSLGFSLKSQDKRYTNTSNSESLGGYTSVGIRLGYQITKQLAARMKIDNLFDKDYQLNKGYNQDGTNLLLSLTYSL